MDVPPEIIIQLWRVSLTAKGRAALWVVIAVSLLTILAVAGAASAGKLPW